MSTYTNKTYVAFDADKDILDYDKMIKWSANNNTSFGFHNAHDLNNLMQTSSEKTIKNKLAERLRNTKIFIVLVGESTKDLFKFVRWEIDQAIKREIPIIVVNLNGKRSKDSDLCPAILNNILSVHVSFDQKIIEHAMNTWRNDDATKRKEEDTNSFYYDDNYKLVLCS